eukprot:s2576_g9.t1
MVSSCLDALLVFLAALVAMVVLVILVVVVMVVRTVTTNFPDTADTSFTFVLWLLCLLILAQGLHCCLDAFAVSISLDYISRAVSTLTPMNASPTEPFASKCVGTY